MRSASALSVCGVLWPTGRGALPVLRPPVRGEVADGVGEHEPVHAAGRGVVRPVDVRTVAQEDTEHEAATGAAVVGERRAARGHERHRPALPRLVRLDLGQRHVRHGHPGDVVLGQPGQPRDGYVVRQPGASRAVVVRPVVHELVDDQLSPTLEQVEQGLRALRRVEDVPIVEPDHREAPPPRGERVLRAGDFLLGLEQLVSGLLPLAGRNDRRFLHPPIVPPETAGRVSWKAGRVTDFASQNLTGARFHDVDLTNARFHLVDLTGVTIRGAALVNVDISGEIQNLRVNGVDVVPLVEPELNRRYPDRVKMRPTDADGFREAWDLLERLWQHTV